MMSFCFCLGDENKPENINTESQMVKTINDNNNAYVIETESQQEHKQKTIPSLLSQNHLSIFEMTDEEKATELDGDGRIYGDTQISHIEHPTNSKSVSQHSILYIGDVDSQKLPDLQQEILDNDELRELSITLLNDQSKTGFRHFINKYLSQKVLNKMWKKLDNKNNGYIETTEDITDIIAFLNMLFKVKTHQKKFKSTKKPQLNKKQLLQQVTHVSTWIVKKYGKKDINTIDKLFVYRVTEQDVLNNLTTWLDDYVQCNGVLRLQFNDNYSNGSQL
eukprot:414917_1